MMKKGFTLAEVLITLGIIGVISAILAPSLGNIMPDKNKAKVLKVYNNVTRLNEELLNDPGIYSYKDNGTATFSGFGDFNAPINPDYSSDPDYPTGAYVDVYKYGLALASKLELDGKVKKITDGVSFTTADGTAWEVTTKKKLMQNGWECDGTIVIDVDPNSSSNCLYGQEDCKKPDKFKFKVDNWGNLSGDDPLTKAYLLNPYKMNDKKNDFKKAAELSKN